MASQETAAQPVIDHPNRELAASRTTRVFVIVLLVVSAVMIALVTFGGWAVLQGLYVICIAWIVIDLVFAYYVWRWNRGVLPVIAALAMIMLIFAALAVPAWFDRDAPGYQQPALDANVLGTICAMLVPVSALLIVVALRGFQQAWNVEVERWPADQPEPLAAS